MAISGEIRIRRFPDWGGLEFVEAREVICDVPRHSHESFCVGIIESGQRIMRIRDREERFGPGDIWLLQPGESHSCVSVGEPHSYKVLCFEPKQISVDLGLKYTGWRVGSDNSWSEETEDLLMLLGFSKSKTELRDALTTWFRHYFTEEITSQENGRIEAASIRKVREYLEKNCAEDLPVKALARMVEMSPFHLERSFRNSVGVPIHLYQKLIRLRRARKMLREGALPSFVAAETGFTDQSHLNRCFKTMMGITPGEYARLCAETRKQ